jgi:hypothetical protein
VRHLSNSEREMPYRRAVAATWRRRLQGGARAGLLNVSDHFLLFRSFGLPSPPPLPKPLLPLQTETAVNLKDVAIAAL